MINKTKENIMLRSISLSICAAAVIAVSGCNRGQNRCGSSCKIDKSCCVDSKCNKGKGCKDNCCSTSKSTTGKNVSEPAVLIDGKPAVTFAEIDQFVD